MNRDHALFLVIGILFGFLAGYVLHEVMAARQPRPAWAGGGPAAPSAPGAGPTVPPEGPGPGAGGGAGPAMEEVQRLRAWVEEHPDDREAVRTLANLNYDIGDWRRAADLYEQYLRLDPGQKDVMTDLGASYRHMGDAERALGLFQQVRSVDPAHWQALYNEILVLAFDLGRLAEARTAMSELERLQPGNPQVERLASELEKREAAG